MYANKEPNFYSRLPVMLIAGVLGLGIGGQALASGSDDVDSVPKQSQKAAAEQQAGDAAMDSRMAPTQNSTATGRNPKANTVQQTPAAKTSPGMDRQNKPEGAEQKGGDDSVLPRMAPTQNTQGTGEKQIDGS
ncbi:hypothetical protein V5738_18220 [Salinisphaera sp. SPP-AMP-43]|uniref:hypothetical protein n=1 Tax=Salinisphaera sp. SPP-AMP-43 TaxID=3121288 RepID=UPI003C6E1CF0